jgi:glycogenin glucosyltransferase
MLSKTDTLGSYDGGDTGFLNAYFCDWYQRPASSRLSFGYNAQRTLYWLTHATRSGYWHSIQPLKIIHYSSSPKPWDCSVDARRGDLEALWWKEHVAAAMPAGALDALEALVGKRA